MQLLHMTSGSIFYPSLRGRFFWIFSGRCHSCISVSGSYGIRLLLMLMCSYLLLSSVSNHRPYRHLATSFSTPKAVVGSYGAEGNPIAVPPRQPRLRARLLRRKALPRPSGHLSACAGLDDSSLTAVRLAVQNFQSFDIMMS